MPVVEEKYRPPQTTQRGIDSTLDDCAVVATLLGIADASSGEYVTTQYGQEKARAGLHVMARKMRKSIGNDPISISERQLMVVKAGYPPPQSVDVSFSDLRVWLRTRRFSVSVSGNPSKIKNKKSPLIRCDCSHEWFIWGECPKHKDSLIYYDGLRPWPGKRGAVFRGECRPAIELRQMAFKNKDNELDFVLKYPVGEWTKQALSKGRVQERLRDCHETIKGLKEALKAPTAPNASSNAAVKRALDAERVELIDLIEQRRPENG